MPAYHLARMEHPYVNLPSEGPRGLVVNFSRGCTWDCSFCSESAFYKRTWRKRSPKRIADELELLKEKYDRTLFYVGDNTFNVTPDQGRGFIEEMLKRKTNQRFWLQSRADLILQRRGPSGGLSRGRRLSIHDGPRIPPGRCPQGYQ